MATTTDTKITCYHCGDPCVSASIALGEKFFCCEGCRTVYQLLDRGGLCEYYRLNDRPGISRNDPSYKDKFAFLEDEKIAARFIAFSDGRETHACFYLPQIHCSSCLFLLENLHKLHQGVIASRVNFETKEVSIVFRQGAISLRQVADLLSSTGYEPYISLRDLGSKPRVADRRNIIRLGVAGFCFANIMLLSFPEYLGLEGAEPYLRGWFRMLNVALALPVFLYSAQPFYHAAWKGLRSRWLNIDAPIVLAIIVTFVRSMYEVLSGGGSGYFDSMSGIVFFMLAGRVLQDRTHRRLSFERDYTSYFPIAVTVLQEGVEGHKALPEIRCGDTLVIHHGEVAPADGIITKGQGLIDYSFVTGESIPVTKEMGELIYAGGRQTGAAMEVLVVKEVAQSYLTSLWNRQEEKKEGHSFIHLLSRRFTYIVLFIAACAAIYWWVYDPHRVANAVTAVLIVACPCALLLSSTFTNGNILRILGHNGLYLRSADVIENMAATTHIVFDKTGTLTVAGSQDMEYEGIPLTAEQQKAVAILAAQSTHPLSRAIAQHFDKGGACRILGFREIKGKGLEGWVDGNFVAMGAYSFVAGSSMDERGTCVYVGWNNRFMGYFQFRNRYRKDMSMLMSELARRYRLSLLSGDNDRERTRLQALMGRGARIFFNQSPEDKADHVRRLQKQGEKVMMVGDGLNDAVGLKQSDTGIAIADHSNNFTPASDAILDGAQLYRLPTYISFCRMARRIILASFILSILYNIAGLAFAVRGNLSPLIAAVLMPASSLSILLVTYGSATRAALWLGLRISAPAEKDHVLP